MLDITSIFLKTFRSITNQDYNELKNNYSCSKEYTKVIFRLLGRCLSKSGYSYCKEYVRKFKPTNNVAKRYYKEYYRIDLVACSLRENIIDKEFTVVNWDLDIAIEHENNYKLWGDEAIKLSHIC